MSVLPVTSVHFNYEFLSKTIYYIQIDTKKSFIFMFSVCLSRFSIVIILYTFISSASKLQAQ